MSALIASVVWLTGSVVPSLGQTTRPVQTARGVVFEDVNGDGVRQEGEPAVAGVLVSDGRRIVRTDDEGRWSLRITGDADLFVIKPTGWRTPTDDHGLPQFYYLHQPDGSPDEGWKFAGVAATGPLPGSIDFPLVRQEEPQTFRVLLFGDPQPRDLKEVDYVGRHVVEELIAADGKGAAFGITLGDIAFDNLDTFEPLNAMIGKIGLPWYNVHGNHDMNFDAPDDRHAAETHRRVYGPTNFAFEYAGASFVVLDNVVYTPEPERPRYHAGLNDDQFEFLEAYVAEVPDDRLLVLTMHIPLYEMPADQRRRLMGLLNGRQRTISFSAHRHYNEWAYFDADGGLVGRGISEPHLVKDGTANLRLIEQMTHPHLVSGATCGTWWRGGPDELGIPQATMRCGAPIGYFLLDVDRGDYAVTFKPARRPVAYQMNLYAAADVRTGETLDLAVNVFAGSERTHVESRVGEGDWVTMTQVNEEDPAYLLRKDLYDDTVEPRVGTRITKAIRSPHLWRASLATDHLPPGTHLIETRATDAFGQTHTGRRTVRIGV